MTTRLRAVLGEIAKVAGEPAAINFAAAKGGARVYIPARVTSKHWLVECVGEKAAAAICAHFAIDGIGQRIDVPLAGGGVHSQLKRAIAKRVHELDQQNVSAPDIARKTGVTQRTVHRHRSAHRGGRGGKQGSLF